MTEASGRVLVTGASGFVGRHLIARLAERAPNWTVVAPGAGAPRKAARPELDVCDAEAVREAVAAASPSHVVHLAAVAAVTEAGQDPRRAWAVNLGGAVNLVEALKREAPQAFLLHVSTAEVYGASLLHGVADETAALQPLNTYAVTKAAADLLVGQEALQGLKACVVRPFNHIGAGQSEAFAMPAFASQIARIEAELVEPVLYVGSLSDERDFLAVQDVVDAYIDLLLQPLPVVQRQIFNVASGGSVTMRDMLDRLLAKTTVPIGVEVDPQRLRGRSPTRVHADAGKLRRATGWAPRVPLDDALSALLDHERERVRASGRP